MRGLERSAAFWLRAYPPAWREQRAAALVDLRHVAWTGRPVEVDRHHTELVPLPIQEAR